MDAKFGNLQLQCQQQFDHETKPTFDPFTVEDLLNLPHDDDIIINQDVEPHFDHFDDHHNQTAVIQSNSNSDSSTVNHIDNSNSFDSLFPLPGGSHLLDELIHAPLPGLGREERQQLIPIEESAVKKSLDSRKYAELAQLQWISDFVGEDSCSSENLNKLLDTTMSAMKARPDECSETQYYPLEPARDESVSTSPIFDTEKSAPTKKAARSKRSRTPSDNWASRPLALAHGDSEPIQVTTSTKPVGLKKKGSGMGRHRSTIDSTQGGEARKCLHCATDKTPQWRSGPMGPKTLCNACGVRYKSGRLVPEYRPAASPTFVIAQHSNSHRKVLELQRQKNAMRLQQMQQQQQFQHDHYNHHIPNNSMMFHPSNNDDYLIHQHFGSDFRNLI
ncbi:GATA transcription factor 12-like isoform X2 [Amaranthus tricolor]|uniref:GATA transcription factor 12-like isoform X2 n=1 Tax=Amaranthus tricolor TaxID=29722 RepID=UPI0025904197|nr:GATA transcription factor 12-like isoform X2 [Amaranthus tricolor]